MGKFALQTLELELSILGKAQGYRRGTQLSIMQDKKVAKSNSAFAKKM